MTRDFSSRLMKSAQRDAQHASRDHSPATPVFLGRCSRVDSYAVQRPLHNCHSPPPCSPSSSSSFSCDVSSTGMQCLLYPDSLPQSPATPLHQDALDVAEAAAAPSPPLQDMHQHGGQHAALDANYDASDDDAYDDDVLRAFKVSAAAAASCACSRQPHCFIPIRKASPPPRACCLYRWGECCRVIIDSLSVARS